MRREIIFYGSTEKESYRKYLAFINSKEYTTFKEEVCITHFSPNTYFYKEEKFYNRYQTVIEYIEL